MTAFSMGCVMYEYASMRAHSRLYGAFMGFHGVLWRYTWYMLLWAPMVCHGSCARSAGAIMVQRCAVSYFNCAAYFRNYAASSFRDGLDDSMSLHAPHRSVQLLPLTTATKNTE